MPAYRILITDNLSPQAVERLEAAGDIKFDVVQRPSKEKLLEIIPDYDALIIRSSARVDADLLKAAACLKVVGRAGMGLDNVDIDAASLQGVVVMNTPGANTIATAEHTMAMMLALCRHVPQADASIRDRQWARSQFVGVQLYGKVLGIIGLGRVGARVARRAQAFDMTVIAYDPYINDDVARELKIELVSLDQLLAQSDFISLNAALTPETKGLINQESIAQMKPGVRLVNCGRGALGDEEALIEALGSGQVAGAALDVFAAEPLADDSPLRQMDNVVLTPHIAASTFEAQRDVGTQIVDQVLQALRGEDFRNAVNMPVADATVFGELKPYLLLAEKLGKLQMQLSEGPVKRVEVEFHGDQIVDHAKPLTVALLKGLLDPITDTPVNYISAPHLALQRGISVSETKGMPVAHYAHLLSCRVSWDGGEHLMSGTLLGHEYPRVVQIDQSTTDAWLEGIILVMDVISMPGLVGRVGTMLSEYDINISAWRVGRTPLGKQILMFVNLDNMAPAEVLEQLAELEGVVRARQIEL